MKLKVLIDNNTLIDRYFIGEPGVAYFIQDGDVNILFDTGYTDAFIKNAQKMNVNLMNLDFVAISHGHIDHTWGLVPLTRLYTEAKIENINHNKPTLIAHPYAFLYKDFNDNEEIGCIMSDEKLGKHFNMNLSKDPVWLTEKIVFLGEIERKNDFENKVPIGKVEDKGTKVDDYVIDDSALVYKSSEGLVIITGCSHAGICNIIEYAKKICKDDRVVDVVGGFHLLNPTEEQLKGTIEYFGQADIKEVHACHCTDLKSKIELSKVVNLKEVGVGLILEYI
ncbi:MBL fold metallo-hydrolase [Anaeromicrobium sediminis]|uniref:MBL fold metallo-hydrolase n=1 Tax=Anaeromicrobium sediminis TaxID=1478221 RepID=A0A267ML85_9FIRM|nr:MBL fold metallo-hydrolase [Anaeromicrobium sediminis]PAB60351.1 MBL fold metallo-hydrolase [Anaeromicrobium sediminis]